MTPSKIQGLFKTVPTLETLRDQATKIYLHFFGQRGEPPENARVNHEAASKTSHSRVSFRQPLTRGLPK